MVIQNFENFIRNSNLSKNHTNDDGLMWNGVIILFKQPFKKESLLKNICSVLLSISIPRAFMFSAFKKQPLCFLSSLCLKDGRCAFLFSLLKKKSYLACFYLLCAFRKMPVVKNLSSVLLSSLCSSSEMEGIARDGFWFSIYLTFLQRSIPHPTSNTNLFQNSRQRTKSKYMK